MFRAALYLATGSFLLLIGSGFFLLVEQGWIPAAIFGALAIGIHMLGWANLGAALVPSMARGAGAQSTLERAVAWAFAGSLVGFGIGLATLPLAFPGSGWVGPYWAFILVTALFPYVPSVFGPVVAAHTTMFLLTAKTLRSRTASITMVAASAFLGAVATVGLLGQAFFVSGLGRGLLSLAGLTGFGYAGIAVSWLNEHKTGQRATKPQLGLTEQDSP